MMKLSSQQRPAGNEEAIDLRSILKVLAKRRILIITGTMLLVLASGLLSIYVLQPVYEAETLLLVRYPADTQRVVSQGQGFDEVVGALSSLPQMNMNTYLGQIKSDALMRRVIDQLDLHKAGYTPMGLARSVDARVQPDSNLIEVKVRNTDPVTAALIANTLSNELLELISEKNQEIMARSVAFLQGQRAMAEKELQNKIQQLEAELAQANNEVQSSRIAMLQDEVDRLKVYLDLVAEKTLETQIAGSMDFGQTSVMIMSEAACPDAPVKPNKKLNIAGAFILGSLLFSGLAFLLEYLDYTIKTPDDVSEHLDLPVLGTIPQIRGN